MPVVGGLERAVGPPIAPMVPVTPGPQVAGPVTGCQFRAQLPWHADFVAVSGPNQYSV